MSVLTVNVSVPHMESKVHAYFTNSASRTAVRGPGEIQASVCMETVLEHVAAALGVSGMAIRAVNLYPEDSPELWKDLAGKEFTSYTIPRCVFRSNDLGRVGLTDVGVRMWNGMMPDYEERQQQVDEFNRSNAFVKRGLSANTVKYEVSQGKNAATVSVYPDGSIICHHDGAEMGQVNCVFMIEVCGLMFAVQGLFTKVMQAAAYTFGKLVGEKCCTSYDHINYTQLRACCNSWLELCSCDLATFTCTHHSPLTLLLTFGLSPLT